MRVPEGGADAAPEPSVSLRPATAADADWLRQEHGQAYAGLERAVYTAQNIAWEHGFFSARITHLDDVFVIERGGTRVGAVYLDQRVDCVFIESLEVAPVFQGGGAGTAALIWVAEHAGDRDVTLRVHKANDGARRLYERCGFTVEAELTDRFAMRRTRDTGAPYPVATLR
jgi:ribosomal protein S18 acetylase RimI-like enzyme